MEVDSTFTDSIEQIELSGTILDWDKNVIVKSFKSLKNFYYIELYRHVSKADIANNIYLGKMPGFLVKWFYNTKVIAERKYENNSTEREFRRYGKFKNIFFNMLKGLKKKIFSLKGGLVFKKLEIFH